MYEPEFLPVVTETRKAKDEIKRAKEEEARRKANEEADDSSAMTLLLEEEKEETIKKAMLSENGHSQLPIVPPKALKAEIKEEEDEVWFFVQSPREQHGAVGPFLVDELRSYRRLGKLHDTTLMWTAEFTNWKPLGTITTLKNKLLTLPPIPKRLSPDKKIDDPIVDIPAILNKNECEKLEVREKFSPSMMCCRCGSTAVTHLPETGEQRPDFKVLRQTIGNFQDASEVIPGLLWIGNASTGRSKYGLFILPSSIGFLLFNLCLISYCEYVIHNVFIYITVILHYVMLCSVVKYYIFHSKLLFFTFLYVQIFY